MKKILILLAIVLTISIYSASVDYDENLGQKVMQDEFIELVTGLNADYSNPDGKVIFQNLMIQFLLEVQNLNKLTVDSIDVRYADIDTLVVNQSITAPGLSSELVSDELDAVIV